MPENKKSVQDDEFDFVDPSAKVVATDDEFDFIDPSVKKKDLALPTEDGGSKSDGSIPGIQTWKDKVVTEAAPKAPITEFGKVGQKATAASMASMEDVSKGRNKLESRVQVTTELAKKSAAKSEQLSSQVFQIDNYIKTLQGQAGKEQELNKAIENRNALGLELNKEISKQNAFAKRAEETQQTIQSIPLGNMESVGNSMSNIATQLKMAIPQSQLAVGNITDKLMTGAFETYLKLTGADLTDAQRKEIAGMSAGNVAAVASQMPGLGDFSSDEVLKEKFDQLEAYKKEMLPVKGIIDTFSEGDVAGGAAALFDAATSIVASWITSIATGGIGLPTTMIGDAVFEYNTEKAKSLGITTDELYSKNLDDVGVPFVVGGLAAALEKVGLDGVTNAINKNLSKAGLKEVVNFIFEGGKEAGTEWVQTGLEAYNTAIASGKDAMEAGQEMWDTMNSKEGYEAALKGAGGSAVSIATGRAAKAIWKSVGPSTQKKVQPLAQKAEVLSAELENPELTTEQANQIEDEITSVTEEMKVQAVSDYETKINLPDEIRVDVDRLEVESDILQGEIDKKELLLANPSISNEARALLSSEVSELKARKDAAVDGITQILDANRKPILNKFTSPTDEQYGTVNRNDGKGIVDLTKEEYLKEEGGTIVENEITPKVENKPKPTFANVPIMTRTADEINTAKNEVFNNLSALPVGSVIENSDGEIKVVEENSIDKKGNHFVAVVTYERQEDGSLRQMTNLVWASKDADGKIKLDYNPHSTGTNSKGERVTVTDQITDKTIDLSKENIFIEENGKLVQINKATPEATAGVTINTETDGKERREEEAKDVLTPTEEVKGVVEAAPLNDKGEVDLGKQLADKIEITNESNIQQQVDKVSSNDGAVGDIAKENEALRDVESTAKALEDKKSSLDEKAKKLGYIGIKQFNAQNQLNENLTDAEKALLQEYSDFQQEIKNLKDENVIAKLSDDEFSSWSKANDITRDDLGKVVKDEEIELAAKRIRILNARGDSKKAESELKKLKESKKKDNWTIESWKERFDEDVEQSEIDDINSSNKEFNKSIDKAVESLLSNEQTPAKEQAPASKEQIESTAKALEGKGSEKLIPLFDVLGEVQNSEYNKQQAIDVINTEIDILPDDISDTKDKERKEQLQKRLDYLSDAKNKEKEIESLFKELEKDSAERLSNSNKKVSEAYHKAKADGSNPELVKAVESLLSKESPKPITDENQGNQEAEGRKEGLLSPAQESEPVSPEIPEFRTALEKAFWLRENRPEEAPVEEDFVDFVAKNSNDAIEIIDQYLKAAENNEERKSDSEGLLKEALQIRISPSEFARHFSKKVRREKKGAEATIKRLHVRSNKGAFGQNKFSDLMEELNYMAENGGIRFRSESEYIEFLVNYYTDPTKTKEDYAAYAESEDMKTLADAFTDRGFGERLSERYIEEFLSTEAFDKLGVREKKEVLTKELKNYEQAEQWFYDQIKSGAITLDVDAPTGVIKRISEDRAREKSRAESTAEAERQRQLNTPRNAVDVARIFREVFNFPPWIATAVARMFDAKARRFSQILGITREEYYSQYWIGNTEQQGDEKGMWAKEAAYGKRLISMFEKADISTPPHEILGHDYIDRIIQAAELGDKESIDDLNTIVDEYIKSEKPKESRGKILEQLKAFNVETNKTEVGARVHEWFAKQAEQWFANGDHLKPEKAETKMGRLFEKFRQHMAELYNTLSKALIPPSDPMKKIFRKLFGEENFEVLENNDRVIQQAKEAAERIVTKGKVGNFIGGLPPKKTKGLSQDPMTPDEMLLAEAASMIQQNLSDKYNIVQDLKKLVYEVTGSKEYWPDIDELKEKLEAIDKPDEGKLFNATIDRILADPTISSDTKIKLREKEIRERDHYSLLEQIQEGTELTALIGAEATADMLIEDATAENPKTEDYMFVTMAQAAVKQMNADKKKMGAEDKKRLTEKAVRLADLMAKRGSSASRVLNSFRSWNMLDADGMMMRMRNQVNEINKDGKKTAAQKARQMEKELKKLKEGMDYLLTEVVDKEELMGRMSEEIAELNKKIEDISKAKARVSKDSKGKPIKKGNKIVARFGMSAVADAFKRKMGPSLSQDEVTDNDIVEAAAEMLSNQKEYSLKTFVKQFNAETRGNYSASDLLSTYRDVVNLMTDNGYQGGFSDEAEIAEYILDEKIIADADETILRRDLLVKHEAAMKALVEKQRKALINDVTSQINSKGLWQQYIDSAIGELVSKVKLSLGNGTAAEKAILEDFTKLLQTAIKEKIDEVLPTAKKPIVPKTAKEIAEQVGDLAKNEEKFAELFDGMVEQLQEKYKNDVNAINALQAFASIKNPFSGRLLSKAAKAQFDGTGWKLGDIAFNRGSVPMGSQMADQVLYDAGLRGTPYESVLRPLIEKAFESNVKEFEAKQLESLASFIVNDAKAAIGATTPANKTFVDDLIAALKKKARENYKAKNKIAPTDPIELIKFALKTQGEADAIGGSLWQQAQAEVTAKIMADPKMTNAQKRDAVKFLSTFSNSVFDTIVSRGTMEKAIVKVLKGNPAFTDANGNIKWSSIITSVGNLSGEAKVYIEEKLRDELGQNYNQMLVDAMIDRITDKYEEILDVKRQELFEKQLRSLSSPLSLTKTKDSRIGGMVGKLIAMDKSGLLDYAQFNELISEYLGIYDLTPQEWNELQYLLEQVDNAPEGFERISALEDATMYLESKMPGYGFKAGLAIMYANMLSGISTFVKNSTGILDVIYNALGNTVSTKGIDPNFLKLMKSGAFQGDFMDILVRGSANQGDRIEMPTDSIGLMNVNTLERWSKIPGLIPAPIKKSFGSLKYVSRVLNSTDAAAQRGQSEQTDYYLTKKLLKFKNPGISEMALRDAAMEEMFVQGVTFIDAINIAIDERNANGAGLVHGDIYADLQKKSFLQDKETVRVKRRAYEIMRSSRDKYIRELSGKDALKTAFKSEFEDNWGLATAAGWLVREGYRGIEKLVDAMPKNKNINIPTNPRSEAAKKAFGSLPQKLTMPIIRGVANFAEIAMEKFLPYGIAKGTIGLIANKRRENKIIKARNQLTDQEFLYGEYKKMQAKNIIKSSIVANAVVFSVINALMEFFPGDDDCIPNGYYGEGESVIRKGKTAGRVTFPVNSVVIGCRIFPAAYFGTMSFSLASAGAYNKQKDEEKFSVVDWVASSFSGMLSASMFESPKRIMDVINPKFESSTKTAGDRILDYGANLVASTSANLVLPWSSFQRQLYLGGRMVLSDNPGQDAITFREKMAKALPILNVIPAMSYERPTVDYVGDPVPLNIKNPEGAGGFFGMASRVSIPDYKKYNASVGLSTRYNGKTLDNSLVKVVLGDEDYWDYKFQVANSFKPFAEGVYPKRKDFSSDEPVNADNNVTFETKEKQKEIALLMFSKPYNSLEPFERKQVNKGLNYRNSVEDVFSSLEGYWRSVYMKEKETVLEKEKKELIRKVNNSIFEGNSKEEAEAMVNKMLKRGKVSLSELNE